MERPTGDENSLQGRYRGLLRKGGMWIKTNIEWSDLMIEY